MYLFVVECWWRQGSVVSPALSFPCSCSTASSLMKHIDAVWCLVSFPWPSNAYSKPITCNNSEQCEGFGPFPTSSVGDRGGQREPCGDIEAPNYNAPRCGKVTHIYLHKAFKKSVYGFDQTQQNNYVLRRHPLPLLDVKNGHKIIGSNIAQVLHSPPVVGLRYIFCQV